MGTPDDSARRGQHERPDHAADRHGRLAHTEREPSLTRREPLHDRAAARGLDASARRGREHQDKARRERGVEEAHRGDEDSTAPEPRHTQLSQ